MDALKNFDYKVSAAGRVNLIGEHVDYCGGKVLPCALSLKNTVYIRANGQDRINVQWTTLDEQVTMPLDELLRFQEHAQARYIAGCAYLWRQTGHRVVGCDMLLDCTVPFGSGLSSSAAIEVSTIAALAAVAGEKADKVDIALVARQAEHQFAHVNCGIMDQYASACGQKDCAMLLDCSTLECEQIPVQLHGCTLVITDSNKPHVLAESKYNERRSETERALALLQRELDVSCLAQVTPEQLEAHKQLLTPVLYKRARHVVEECERVKFAAEALREGRLDDFGLALNASHRSLAELYEVTGRELDALAMAAQQHPACLGSRMTGGGFGGCTVSLVRSSAVEDFKQYVFEAYFKQTGYRAKCYETEIADGLICTEM